MGGEWSFDEISILLSVRTGKPHAEPVLASFKGGLLLPGRFRCRASSDASSELVTRTRRFSIMSIPLTSVLCAEISLRSVLAAGGSNAKNCANVFHYRRTSTSVDPTKAALATIFDSTIVQPLLDLLNVDVGSMKMHIRWVDDADDLYSEIAPTPNTAGQVTGERYPSTVCVSTLFRTAKRGRNYRGAKRFYGASEADGVDDVLSGTPLTNWTTFAALLDNPLTDSTGNVWNPCVLSRTLSQLSVNPTTVVREDITTVLLNKNFGRMDRRRVATVR
jgi:hypothetical protein